MCAQAVPIRPSLAVLKVLVIELEHDKNIEYDVVHKQQARWGGEGEEGTDWCVVKELPTGLLIREKGSIYILHD